MDASNSSDIKRRRWLSEPNSQHSILDGSTAGSDDVSVRQVIAVYVVPVGLPPANNSIAAAKSKRASLAIHVPIYIPVTADTTAREVVEFVCNQLELTVSHSKNGDNSTTGSADRFALCEVTVFPRAANGAVCSKRLAGGRSCLATDRQVGSRYYLCPLTTTCVDYFSTGGSDAHAAAVRDFLAGTTFIDELIQMSPLVVARCLTLRDYRLFAAIETHEYWAKLHAEHGNLPSASDDLAQSCESGIADMTLGEERRGFANLTAFEQTANEETLWVVSEILRESSIERRVKVVKFFIQLALVCCVMRNLHSCMNIMFGLQHSSVQRLSQTWSRVKRSRKTSKQFLRRLLPLVDCTRNFGNYRALLNTGSLDDEDDASVMLDRLQFLLTVPFWPIAYKDMTALYLLDQSRRSNRSSDTVGVADQQFSQLVDTIRTMRRSCRWSVRQISAVLDRFDEGSVSCDADSFLFDNGPELSAATEPRSSVSGSDQSTRHIGDEQSVVSLDFLSEQSKRTSVTENAKDDYDDDRRLCERIELELCVNDYLNNKIPRRIVADEQQLQQMSLLLEARSIRSASRGRQGAPRSPDLVSSLVSMSPSELDRLKTEFRSQTATDALKLMSLSSKPGRPAEQPAAKVRAEKTSAQGRRGRERAKRGADEERRRSKSLSGRLEQDGVSLFEGSSAQPDRADALPERRDAAAASGSLVGSSCSIGITGSMQSLASPPSPFQPDATSDTRSSISSLASRSTAASTKATHLPNKPFAQFWPFRRRGKTPVRLTSESTSVIGQALGQGGAVAGATPSDVEPGTASSGGVIAAASATAGLSSLHRSNSDTAKSLPPDLVFAASPPPARVHAQSVAAKPMWSTPFGADSPAGVRAPPPPYQTAARRLATGASLPSTPASSRHFAAAPVAPSAARPPPPAYWMAVQQKQAAIELQNGRCGNGVPVQHALTNGRQVFAVPDLLSSTEVSRCWAHEDDYRSHAAVSWCSVQTRPVVCVPAGCVAFDGPFVPLHQLHSVAPLAAPHAAARAAPWPHADTAHPNALADKITRV